MKAECRSQKSESSLPSQLQKDGFEIIQAFLRTADCERLIKSIERSSMGDSRRSTNRRNVLEEIPEVLAWTRSQPVMDLLTSRGQRPHALVRGILFDKTPEANWPVTWHQDQTISVVERIEATGFHAWSVKQGVPHVRAPRHVLERMITVRLHLDDCSETNGALRVLPGSHRDGLLDDDDIERRLQRVAAKVCDVPRGGLLLMKPLLLHASSPSENPGHRRVLHIEYALDPLPGGLNWLTHVPVEAKQ